MDGSIATGEGAQRPGVKEGSALKGITEYITEYKRRKLCTALITDFTETFSHLLTPSGPIL